MNLDKIWDVLVRHCGAPSDADSKMAFVHLAKSRLSDGLSLEYRFMGRLGSGGKVWLRKGDAPYVNCYPEDETPSRRKDIKKVNKLLEDLS